MLPPATLLCVDRLITTLMTLVRATAHIATTGSTPTLPEPDAHALFRRLAHLVRRLIQISHFGLPTPRTQDPDREPPATPAPIAQPRQPTPSRRLPRRPGWLLEALPDIAPAIADDLRPLLADPAIATLFDTAPHLHRAFRPLLRALALQPAPPTQAPPPPAAPPPQPPPPNPAAPNTPTPAPPIPAPKPTLSASSLLTPYPFR